MEGSTCDRLNAYGELLVLDEETSCAASSALNVGLLAIANTVLASRCPSACYITRDRAACSFTADRHLCHYHCTAD